MNFSYFFLQLKILSGYLLILFVVICMIFIFFHERQCLREIEKSVIANRHLRKEMNETHCHITELVTLGELVVNWEKKDYDVYHIKRLHVDSLLHKLQEKSVLPVCSKQIHNLRNLLSNKEQHLLHIMKIFHKQGYADSLLVNHLPLVSKQVTLPQKVIRKKNGIAGLLGMKKIVLTRTSPDTLYALNKQLIRLQKERNYYLSSYSDTLRLKNVDINDELLKLVIQIDNMVHQDFEIKEMRIEKLQKKSFLLMVGLLVFSILLLLTLYLIIHHDIRRKEKTRQIQEDIIKQNRELLEMRKKIILTISHDIRGPLNRIKGSAELAMDTYDKKKRTYYIKNIQASCQHILRLVNNLLDIYRMNECKEVKNNDVFRLDQLIDRIIVEYSHKSKKKGLAFTSILSGLEVNVEGDTDRLEQILDNLLVNAIKFTEIGEISLNASYENELLTMEIKDTGIGVDEETKSRIFEPFERADQEVNSEGFGLGLSITKGLVGLLGGTISVESSVGKGSTFCVVLPLVQTEGNEEEHCKNVTRIMQLPRQVLVIDDDTVQLEVIKEMLECSGVACKTCNHVQEVVQTLRQHPVDLVLTDIQMPGTNGFDLLNLLRNSHIGNSQTVPVIAMTARGDSEIRHFMEAGFSGCINKPFSTKELLSFLSSVILQENKENNTVANFKELTSETNDKHKILELFLEEAKRNIAELQESLEAADRKRLRETLHRMFPVWELLKADKPLQVYRKLLHDEQADENTIREETTKVIACTHELILKAKSKLAKLEHETEHIDC